MKKLILVFIIINLGFIPNQVFADEKISIGPGIGFPELLNVNLRYDLNNFRIGICAGKLKGTKDDTSSYSVDLSYFLGNPQLATSKSHWYGKFGVNYFYNKNKYATEKCLYLNPRIGREIPLNKNLGAEIDAGILYQVHRDKTEKDPTESDYTFDIDLNFKFLPSIGVRLYYKF